MTLTATIKIEASSPCSEAALYAHLRGLIEEVKNMLENIDTA